MEFVIIHIGYIMMAFFALYYDLVLFFFMLQRACLKAGAETIRACLENRCEDKMLGCKVAPLVPDVPIEEVVANVMPNELAAEVAAVDRRQLRLDLTLRELIARLEARNAMTVRAPLHPENIADVSGHDRGEPVVNSTSTVSTGKSVLLANIENFNIDKEKKLREKLWCFRKDILFFTP